MKSGERWTLVAATLGSSMVFLDATVVNVALPAIARDLPASIVGVLEGQSFVYSAYLLSLSALLILAGALNDYFGRRRMFTIGLVGFGLTSALCGLAPSMELLIVFRVLQGAAGALLVPGSLSILTDAFSGEDRGRAIGIWAAASSATTLLGPFVGGLLVDSVSWRAAFLINVPLLVPALWATLAHVRESRDERATGRFDWLGALVVALAVGGLSLGAIRGQETNWQDPSAFVALAVGAVAAVLFPLLMVRSANPLVPPDLFRSRNFSVTNLSTLLIYGALYVSTYFLGLFMQGTLGYTAAAAGLAGLPVSLFLIALSSRFGALAGRLGPRIFMSVGPAVMAVGILWFARIPANSTAWRVSPSDVSTLVPPTAYLTDLLPGYLLFGFGLAMMVAPLTTALMASVPARNAGLASAINNAISRVGPQLAGAVIFVAITASFYAGLASRVPGIDPNDPGLRRVIAPLNPPTEAVPPELEAAATEASTDAIHLAMLVSAGLLLAGAAVNAVGIRNHRLHGIDAADAELSTEPHASHA
jgi:EmrB/QacA subfamily drug resistance transporter